MIGERPNLVKASLRRDVWMSSYPSFRLMPNGWLIGVTLENTGADGYMSGRFEITDDSEVQLFGSFSWEYAAYSCGIIFPEPLPNINAAAPYMVRRLDRTEDDGPVLPVIVSEIGCW